MHAHINYTEIGCHGLHVFVHKQPISMDRNLAVSIGRVK